MRCRKENNEDAYYVMKFQNNPQHLRILVNELLGTRLARRLGLPAAVPSVVEVRPDLIERTAEFVIELGRGRWPCRAGQQFGSRYPGDPRKVTLHDFLPDERLREVENLHEFAGMLVFDKWTCNTNGRQTVFFDETKEARGEAAVRYKTRMIDQGFCFNAGEWNFPDAPLRGLYARNRVYQGITGMESFAPWLERLENSVTERVLDDIGREIPPAWYEDEYDALAGLLEHLYQRRARVGELILQAKKSYRQPFPNWK